MAATREPEGWLVELEGRSYYRFDSGSYVGYSKGHGGHWRNLIAGHFINKRREIDREISISVNRATVQRRRKSGISMKRPPATWKK